MNSKEFATHLKNNTGNKAALVIGFEGGSVLMGHSSWVLFARELEPRVPLPRRTPYTRKAAWQSKQLGDKLDFLRKHTKPNEINPKAIDCIAGFLNEGYIHAVLATDTNQALFTAIRERLRGKHTAIERFDCARDKPEYLLSAVKSQLIKGHVFLDGSDRILNLGSSHADADERQTGLTATFEAIKRFMNEFDEVFCWGWCELNVLLADIWRPQQGKLFLLGTDSEIAGAQVLGIPTESVEQKSRVNKGPTVDALLGIGRILWGPKGPSISGTDGRHSSFTFLSDTTRVERLQPALLWNSDIRGRISERLRKGQLAVFGVDGRLVRVRLAREILSSLATQQPLLRSDPEIASLLRTVSAYSSSGFEASFVVEFAEEAEIPQQFISRLRKLNDVIRDSAVCVALFVPVSWAEHLADLKEVFCFTDTYYATGCLNRDAVSRWVKECAETAYHDLNEDDYARLARLAVDIVSAASPPGPAALDWLHEALDLWRSYLVSHNNEDFSFAVAEQLWKRVLKDFPFSEDRDDPDFDLKVVPKPSPRPVSGPNLLTESFNLDLKRKQRNGP